MLFLSIWDLIITPVLLVVLSALARKQRDKRYPPGHPLRPYFMKGLYLKFFGAVFIGLVFQFYYGGGDTFNYYYHSQLINKAFSASPSVWLKLLFRTPPGEDPLLNVYISKMYWYDDPSAWTVAAIGAVCGLPVGSSYMGIALMFAYLSFTGIWAMFRTFANIYPHLHKQLAIAFFFIPSTFVWGSGIFKDTVCMCCLGWLTYTTFRIFVNRDFSVKNMSLLVVSFYLISKIKIYILLAFMPALTIWLLNTYSARIMSSATRMLVKGFFISVALAGFLFFTKLFAEELNKYSLDNIAKTAETTRNWISFSSGDEGSAYDLGAFDPSLTGMLTKFPQAVVVTLFRPFPWEARKVIVMLSALEALAFIYFTFQAFRKRGPGNAFRMIGKDPNLFFCLIFALIFAFAVGISSYNFGTLSRYKIPCLPFYATFLVILMYNTGGKAPIMAPVRRRRELLTPIEPRPEPEGI